MKRGAAFFIVLSFILLLAGCGAAGNRNQEIANQLTEVSDMKSNAGEMMETAQINAAEISLQERKVVRNADLQMQVKETAKAISEIEQYARSLGGLVAEMRSQNYGESGSGFLHLQLPAEKLDSFLDWLPQAGKVENQRLYTEDVTEQYIDLDARVQTLSAQESRLTELLEKANNVDEILKVQKEIERVRADRESLQGKLNYLRNRVAFSNVNIDVYEPQSIPGVRVQGFNEMGQRIVQSFIGGWNTLQNFVAGIIIFSAGIIPLIPVIAAFAFIAAKILQWRNKIKPPSL